MPGSISKKINRILNYPERQKVKQLIENPPPVKKNSVVFTSTEDFSVKERPVRLI